MKLLVAGRITGSVLIICAYFVILHISAFYGAIIHVIADIICIPFYIQNKQWGCGNYVSIFDEHSNQ